MSVVDDWLIAHSQLLALELVAIEHRLGGGGVPTDLSFRISAMKDRVDHLYEHASVALVDPSACGSGWSPLV